MVFGDLLAIDRSVAAGAATCHPADLAGRSTVAWWPGFSGCRFGNKAGR